MSTYTSSLALKAALGRIETPSDQYFEESTIAFKNYEHHVGTWACTKLKEIFHGGRWAITPEQRDDNSGNKPDLVVEKAIQSRAGGPVVLRLHLGMELKKVNERVEEPLDQLRRAITQTVDDKGSTSDSDFEVYAVVQCGLKIAFFELHSDESNLDDEGIPHFRGCVSLTQAYRIGGHVAYAATSIPNDLERLYFDSKRLECDTLTRKKANAYTTPCIYDLRKHETDINELFQYIERNPPRSSW